MVEEIPPCAPAWGAAMVEGFPLQIPLGRQRRDGKRPRTLHWRRNGGRISPLGVVTRRASWKDFPPMPADGFANVEGFPLQMSDRPSCRRRLEGQCAVVGGCTTFILAQPPRLAWTSPGRDVAAFLPRALLPACSHRLGSFPAFRRDPRTNRSGSPRRRRAATASATGRRVVKPPQH